MKQALALPHCMTLRCSEQMEFIKHDSPHAPTMLPDCSHRSTLLVGIKPPRMKFGPLLLPAQLFPESVLFCWIQKKEVQMGNQDNTGCFKGKCQHRRGKTPFFVIWFKSSNSEWQTKRWVHPCLFWLGQHGIDHQSFFPNQLLGLCNCYKNLSDSGPGLTSGQPTFGDGFQSSLLESERLPSAPGFSTHQLFDLWKDALCLEACYPHL